MLSSIHSRCEAIPMMADASMRHYEERRNRDEGEDMQKAIALLYEFKAQLDKLHPTCLTVIENMLQRPRY